LALLSRAAPVLDALFPGAADGTAAQRRACERTALRRLTLVTGGPGTGKTYTAARALLLLQALHAGAAPLRVALAAPTGKAAARLRQSVELALTGAGGSPLAAQLSAGTLHRLLGWNPSAVPGAQAAPAPVRADVLVVDEASMIDAEMMDALLAALPAGSRLLLLGDADQLASVEAGAVLADVAGAAADAGLAGPDAAPLAAQTVRLTHTHRFGGAIGRLATAVRDGDAAALLAGAAAAEAADPTGDAVRWLPPTAGLAPAALAQRLAQAALDPSPDGDWPSHADWLQQLAQRPAGEPEHRAWVARLLAALERFRVLCALRDGPTGVAGVNAAVERLAAARGWLQPGAAWYSGRVVMVTRNDPGSGLYNGDIGLVLPLRPGREGGMAAWFAGTAEAGPRPVAVTRLPQAETAFAMTVHKSQGSEFQHAMLVLPAADSPVLTRELLYTGITRARRRLTLCAPEARLGPAVLQRRTLRQSGLREALAPLSAGSAAVAPAVAAIAPPARALDHPPPDPTAR
jgi:exodeoxyribonuclease V alpha subunit